VSDSTTFIVVVALFVVLVGSRALRKASVARAHRNVAGLAIWSLLAVVLVVIVISLVLAPGAWSWLYDHTIGLYSGR
jgi:uncharacterized membrane protein YidH (DUF202 family)